VSLADRHAAYLGRPDVTIERLSPLLRQAGYQIHRAADAVSVLDRLWNTACEVVVVNHPVVGLSLDDLLATIRDRSSPSRNTGLVLVVADQEHNAMQTWVGRGVNRVVPRSAVSDGLLGAVGDLLDPAPRLPTRAVVQVESAEGGPATSRSPGC
jgi:DNA-binding NarL/FixJ family response regulator